MTDTALTDAKNQQEYQRYRGENVILIHQLLGIVSLCVCLIIDQNFAHLRIRFAALPLLNTLQQDRRNEENTCCDSLVSKRFTFT